MRVFHWLRGWLETLVIKYKYPELYRQLAAGSFDEEDFTEVGPPQ